MSLESQAAYEAVVSEMVATSPTTSGKMFGMPCALLTVGARGVVWSRRFTAQLELP